MPLEIWLHAIWSGMTQRAYADKMGFAKSTLQDRCKAAEVWTDIRPTASDAPFAQLVEIHAAPRWLWSALVSAMVEGM
jgi:hypothetical protein